MGKVEDMRRLREQRAAQAAKAVTAPVRASTQAAPPVRSAPTLPPVGAADGSVAETGLCGHTSISGRSCTRERDHQKAGTKNHRYG